MTPRLAALAALLLAAPAAAAPQMLGFADVQQWCGIDVPKADGKAIKIDNAKVRRTYADAAGLTVSGDDLNKTMVTDEQKPLFCRIGRLQAFNAAVGEFTKFAKDNDITKKNTAKFEGLTEFYAVTRVDFACAQPKAEQAELDALNKEYSKVLQAYLTRPLGKGLAGLGSADTTREAAGDALSSVSYHISTAGKAVGDENCARTVLIEDGDKLKNRAKIIAQNAAK